MSQEPKHEMVNEGEGCRWSCLSTYNGSDARQLDGEHCLSTYSLKYILI